MARPSGRPMRDELLDAATELIQTDGVGALSVGDVARRVGIAAPSVHHHFRRRDDLIAAVADRYRQSFDERLSAIDDDTAPDRIRSYARIFQSTADEGRSCPCASLAVAWSHQGPETREAVADFFDAQRRWLAGQIMAGTAGDEFRHELDPDAIAALILDALEGALTTSRPRQAPGTTIETILQLLT